MTPFDVRACQLGEGPLWHPEIQTLFWFDIIGKRLLSRTGAQTREWHFDRHYSAAGWVDRKTLLIASEDALWRFEIATGAQEKVCPLDADDPVTRSNDGRADPWGGFWIGTMGKQAERDAGAIYRYYRGDLRKLFSPITIANAISFAPDRSCAYFTDTVTQKVMRQPLAPDTGWPEGAPQVHIDLTAKRLNPDGAVTDAEGNLWIACWGAACVACFDPDGTERLRFDIPARQPTCPAFGGAAFRDLHVTSATDGLRTEEMEKRPLNGTTFVIENAGQGVPEPRVIL